MSLHDDHRPGFESNYDPQCGGCAGKQLHGLADYIADVLGISHQEYIAHLETLTPSQVDLVLHLPALPIYLAIRGAKYVPIPQALVEGIRCPRCEKDQDRDTGKGILTHRGDGYTNHHGNLRCDVCRQVYKPRPAVAA